MTIDFIAVLSGVQVTPLTPLVQNIAPAAKNVLSILGLRSESPATRLQRALYIYRIVQASPHVSVYVPSNVVVQDYTGRLPTTTYSTENVGILQTAAGPGRVLPVAPTVVQWPYPDTCTLKKLTQNTAMFSCGSYSKVCPYNKFSDTSIAVSLPNEFGIKGNIKITDQVGWDSGSFIYLPIRFRYPVRTVIELLKGSNDAYNLLEHYDFASDFYNADRPEECIALVAVALYRELTHG